MTTNTNATRPHYKIFIIDYLGEHAKGYDYTRNLRQLLELIPETEVDMVTNYSDRPGMVPVLVNQYKGNVFNQVVSLYKNYRRLNKLVEDNEKSYFIFVAYGNQIDISFLRIIGGAVNHVIDVQGIVAKQDEENDLMIYNFAKTYVQRVENVISHSEFTNDFLESVGFGGTVFRLPQLTKEDVEMTAAILREDNEDSREITPPSEREREILVFLQSFRKWLKAAGNREKESERE